MSVVAGIYSAVRHCPGLCDEGIPMGTAADRASDYWSSATTRRTERKHANGGKRHQPSKLHHLCLLLPISVHCPYIRTAGKRHKLQSGHTPLSPMLGY